MQSLAIRNSVPEIALPKPGSVGLVPAGLGLLGAAVRPIRSA